MKRLFVAAFAVGLLGCANQPAPPAGPTVTGDYPYSRYATTGVVWGYRAPTYRNWTTAQLQERRLQLYGMNPLTQTREGIPPISITGSRCLRKMRSRRSKLN